ncbi:MAG: D-aminoacylase, partial [Rhodospirillales bacterium]|nr:D-aminoacylase [Rhodospirillales bacterium]
METPFDVLIKGGTIIDGSGAPGVRADLAIRGDEIVAIGDLSGDLSQLTATDTVDATGQIVAPGFIDVHTHDDRLLLECPEMTPKVSQGVTSVVVGNCGVSLAPYSGKNDPPPPMNLLGTKDWFRFDRARDYTEALGATPAATNAVLLCGHSSLRASVMDDLDRAATPGEIHKMIAMLDEALDAGYVGLSTGLAYPTAFAAPTEEVIELARVVASRGGLHTTHMRDEEDLVLDAIDETIRIGCEAGCASVISHFKVCGEQNYGRTHDTLAKVQEAQAHMRLDVDVYPYTASSTILLKNSIDRSERVMITWCTPYPEMAGRDLSDIVAEWGVSENEAVDRLSPAGAVYFQMDEQDLQRVLANPNTMIGSDGLPHDQIPHPRLWGTFPRILGRYVRELGVLNLEQAIHRMTGVPARVFGLDKRGTLAPGMMADVVMFDPDTVIDTATFDD